MLRFGQGDAPRGVGSPSRGQYGTGAGADATAAARPGPEGAGHVLVSREGDTGAGVLLTSAGTEAFFAAGPSAAETREERA